MDEIDFYDPYADSLTASLEFEGEGSLGLSSPEDLAQEILENLQSLKETYTLAEDDLAPLVVLLNDVFTVVESVPGVKSHCRALQEERDELEEQWRKEKERGRKRMEERSEYELVLEKENKEMKESIAQFKKKAIDSKSRLETVKTFYEEQKKANEEETQKKSTEYNKLWGIIECYQQKYEQFGASSTATMRTLRRGHRLLSTKQSPSPVAHSILVTTPTHTPEVPTPGANTPTTPVPTAFKLRLDRRPKNITSLQEEGVVGREEDEESEMQESQTGEKSEADKQEKSTSEAEKVQPLGSDVISQAPVKPRRIVRRKEDGQGRDADFDNPEPLGDSDGDDDEYLTSDDELESSGELQGAVAPVSPSGVTLVETLLTGEPDYLAKTEMTRLLKDLESVQKEKSAMLLDKQEQVEEIVSLQKRNTALTEEVQLLNEKEDRLKEELARAKDNYLNIEVDNDLSHESGLSLCCTKEELFGKLRELMDYKVRNIELKDKLARLRERMPESAKKDSTPPKKGNFFTNLFKKTPKKSTPDTNLAISHRPTVREKDYDTFITKKYRLRAQDFVHVTGWLLGPNATKMINTLPTVVGKIGLGIFEVERVDCAVVARVTSSQPAPQKPSRNRKDMMVTKGTWTQGGIPNYYRSHAVPCNVEIWVATTARNDTKIEVVSVFARATQHIQHMFKVNLSHIQCMMAIEGRVTDGKDKEEEETKLSDLPDVTDEELVTMWLVASSGQIHFHEVGALPFKRRNVITLSNNLGAFCVEHVSNKVLIGQSKSSLAVFERSQEGLWNVEDPSYVDLSEFAEGQDIRSILDAGGEKVWLGMGDRIIIVSASSFEVKGGILVNVVCEKPFQIGQMVAVGDTVVVTQHRGSTILLCGTETHSVIGTFDITDLCNIYEQDKVHLKSVVVVSSISADENCIYVGTKSGYVLCFLMAAIREYLQASNQRLSEQCLAESSSNSPAETSDVNNAETKPDLVEEGKSPIRYSVETTCSAVSLNGHAMAVRALLRVPIPSTEEEKKGTDSTECKPLPPSGSVVSTTVPESSSTERTNSESKASTPTTTITTTATTTTTDSELSATATMTTPSAPKPEAVATVPIQSSSPDLPTKDRKPGPSYQLKKRKANNAPKRFKELMISVGIGHKDQSSVGQGLFNVVAPRQAQKTEILVWGQPEK